ncbi:hypothetical protein [Streptomyces sp. NPDC057403]|uniref:hypothetical protein n=1 Tax=Streptomyces sp. NPDC057403 TaxID=3346119 RepID=UPI00368EF4A2
MVAESLEDVLEVVSRIGIVLAHEEAAATALIEWRGGGAAVWPRLVHDAAAGAMGGVGPGPQAGSAGNGAEPAPLAT